MDRDRGRLARVVRTHFDGFLVQVHAAAHQRGRRGDQAGEDREREGRVQAVAERPGDQLREERPAGEDRPVVSRDRREHLRAGQVVDRVVAEEGGEQDRDRRRASDRLRAGRGDAVGLEPRSERVRKRPGQSDDHQREEDPDRQHLGAVHEGLVHAAAGAAISRRQAVHHRRPVG